MRLCAHRQVGDFDANAKFLRAALPMLERAPGLERYAWFADRWPSDESIYKGVSLFDESGGLTVVGDVYREGTLT